MSSKRSKFLVVIRADGSKTIGMGHIFPMLSLAKELSSRSINCHFISLNDGHTLKILKSNNLPVSIIGSTKNFKEIKKHIIDLQPNLVLNNTWRNETKDHLLALKSANSPLMGLYQTKLGLSVCDLVINPLPAAFVKIDATKVNAKYYFGPEYLILPKEITQNFRHIKSHTSVRRILISIGGTDTWNLAAQIIKQLQGLDSKLMLDHIQGNLPQAEFFRRVAKSDLIITSGGNTIFETAYLGVPALGIASEPWEKISIKYAQEKGWALYLGYRDIIKSKSFARRLKQTLGQLTERKRTEMAIRGRQIVDGGGLQRTTKLILKFVENESRRIPMG